MNKIKNLLVKLPVDLHYKIKRAAMENEITLQDWVRRTFMEKILQETKGAQPIDHGEE